MDELPANNIMKYPNQKLISIHKEVCDETHFYMKTNKKAMYQAMKTFHGRKAPTFELWCYLSANAEDYTFALSQVAVEEAIGMKIDAYNTAVNNLIEEGYLVVREGSNTVYDFYEIPQKPA